MSWGWEKNTEREKKTKTNKTKERISRLVAFPLIEPICS